MYANVRKLLLLLKIHTHSVDTISDVVEKTQVVTSEAATLCNASDILGCLKGQWQKTKLVVLFSYKTSPMKTK